MAAAKARGMTPLETMIDRPERTPGQAPVADSMQETAFGLSANGVSQPIKTPTGWVVMKNVETRPPTVPALADIRDNVLAAVRRQKAEVLALERAKQLVTDARAGDFAAAAKKAGAVTGETPVFTRAKPADRLPGDAMIAALQTPPARDHRSRALSAGLLRAQSSGACAGRHERAGRGARYALT